MLYVLNLVIKLVNEKSTLNDNNALLTTKRRQNGDEFEAYIGFCNIDISAMFPNGPR